MKLTPEKLQKLIMVISKKMALPFEHYIRKKIKSGELDQEDVLHLVLNSQINMIVKAIVDLRIYLNQYRIDLESKIMVKLICDNAEKYFEEKNKEPNFKKKDVIT